jgi:hypothetical protein
MGDLLIRSGNYIRERRNFLKFAVMGFGTVASVLAFIFFGSYGGWPLWIFLIAVSFAVGYRPEPDGRHATFPNGLLNFQSTRPKRNSP